MNTLQTSSTWRNQSTCNTSSGMSGVGYMDGDGDGLRERRPVKQQDMNSNSNGGLEPQQEKKEKTFGRTPDGTGE